MFVYILKEFSGEPEVILYDNETIEENERDWYSKDKEGKVITEK